MADGEVTVKMPPTVEELQAEVERLKEQIRVTRAANPKLTLKVSEKGALSVYGIGRFPVTLYASQWMKVLDHAKDIQAFLVAKAGELATKNPSDAEALLEYATRAN